SLAERLGLETLAEGVETAGEHAMLAQLGCGHVQGFGIARPMPYEATTDWIAQHRARLTTAPRIGHRAK
ncbi:MAG TPA: EAL domain-containing protein, partial [Paracoccaceae bacterium]